MNRQLSRHAKLLALAALVTGSLLLGACGGGGGGGSGSGGNNPAPPGPVSNVSDNSTLPGIVEGTLSGSAEGTSTGVITGVSQGTSAGTISGTSSGQINGTVTGTVTQVVNGNVTSTDFTNTNLNAVATVTGTIVGTVTGTVNGNVSGTVVGIVTGTVTGVVSGTSTGTVTPVAVSALNAQQVAKGFLQNFDALRSSYKSAGSDYYSLQDACVLGDGNSKPQLIADWDASTDKQARTAFEIGSTRANGTVTVLADRTITTADGARRELDIEYAVTYPDGSRDNSAIQTIISGSSAGATMANGTACATPENKPQWRFYGNRKIVNFSMVPTNEILDRYNLSNGLQAAVPEQHNKFLDLRLRDPSKVATYYTISGPGLVFGGAPATLVGISPRLLRDAPEFAGKRGNNVDWRDIDTFRFCRNANGNFVGLANLTSCTTEGANGSTWGSFSNTTAALADTNFNALGMATGSVYTIKVYGDDAWKTPTLIASRTPLATLSYTLTNLPYSAAALDLSAVRAYPDLTNVTLTSVVGVTDTAVSLAQIIREKSAFTANAAWASASLTMPDGTVAKTTDLTYFVSGRATNTTSAFPGSRQFGSHYPAPNATTVSINQPALTGNMVLPTFGQLALNANNRNGNVVSVLVTFN